MHLRPREDNAMNGDDGISDELVAAKIRRALLSGPDSITREATVAEMDARGKMTVLRPGTNTWVCVPGNENIIGQADMRGSDGDAVDARRHGEQA
jgi:hypothetical protein